MEDLRSKEMKAEPFLVIKCPRAPFQDLCQHLWHTEKLFFWPIVGKLFRRTHGMGHKKFRTSRLVLGGPPKSWAGDEKTHLFRRSNPSPKRGRTNNGCMYRTNVTATPRPTSARPIHTDLLLLRYVLLHLFEVTRILLGPYYNL